MVTTVPPAGSSAYIKLVGGGTFYLHGKHTWDTKKIAHNLSIINRFAGQSRFPVSVADHSIRVARLMYLMSGNNPKVCMEGLLHDAHESIIVDMPHPWKGELPSYVSVEDSLEASIREEFNLPPEQTELCAVADQMAFFIEVEDCFDYPEEFEDPLGAKSQALEMASKDDSLRCYERAWRDCRADFNRIYTELAFLVRQETM